MAESKYSLRLAAVDAYSTTFGDFKKKGAQLQDAMKLQAAELKSLNETARSVDGYGRLTEKLKATTTALEAARVEQSKAKREQSAAAATVRELTVAHEKAAATSRELGSATDVSASQVRAAAVEEARLARELKGATGAMQRLDQAQDKATAGVKTLQAAQRAETNELDRLKSSLTAAGVDTGKLAAEQKRLEAATEAANGALAAQKARLQAVQAAQSKIDANRSARGDLRGKAVETAALAYVASRPINQAMNLETAMADVGKVINFEGSQKAEMASANLKMASDRLIASSGMSAIDLAKIEYAAGQSGIGNDVKGKDGKVDPEGKQRAIMDFTRDAAIMGSAFDIDAQTAGETMAGWRASMDLNRAQTLDLADSTNYLGNNFNATAADIASVVKRYGAVGKASGLTPEQTAALSAAFLNPGTEKEIAGTGFKNFTSALVAGKSATKGEKAQWKELGFDPEDLAAGMQSDAPGVIMNVLEAIRDQPVEEQAAIATNLFGSESIGAIQPLLQNLGEVRRAFEMVKDKSQYATSAIGENGSMMQEAAGVANTSRTGWNAFTARLTRLSTVIGNAMLPVLNTVLGPLGSLVDMVASAGESFPRITGGLAVAAAGLVALKAGALGLKFVGLMLGQAANKGGLARAKLDATTATTAMRADAAVARLNATLGRVGATGGAGVGGAGRRAAPAAARAGRLSRIGSAIGRVFRPAGAVLGAAGVAGAVVAASEVARGSPKLTLVPPAAAPSPVEPAGARVAPKPTLVPPAAAPSPVEPAGARMAPKLTLVPSATAPTSLEPAGARVAPNLTLVPPTPPVPAAAAVEAVEDVAKAPGLMGRAAGIVAPISKILGKVATPLMVASGAVSAAEGIAEGDSEKVGGAVGGMGGGLAGASAGAALGTLILPGIGTAVGGAIGGLAGSGIGEWIGEKLGGLYDRLKSPEATAQEVAKSSTENKTITFAPVLQMMSTGMPAYDKQMQDQMIARLKAEILGMPSLGGGQLAERRSASLTDGSD